MMDRILNFWYNHLFNTHTTIMHNKERNEEATQLYMELTPTLFFHFTLVITLKLPHYSYYLRHVFLNRRRNPGIEADELSKLAYILHYESKNDRDSIKRWSDV